MKQKTSYVIMVDSEDGNRTLIREFCNNKEGAEQSAKSAINDGRETYIYKLIEYTTKVNKVNIKETK